ncbi:MAG: DUF4038 domain-containing protein [Armatimonadetes bacterium]|nr:DUF4038 domain-containing protein [Armatimonadota bacterium]
MPRSLHWGQPARLRQPGGGPLLRVSDNRRYLVQEDGRPFFWLGVAAWEPFHPLIREEAPRYLKDRAAKGFTVIQAVALAELDGVRRPNAYGHYALISDDPARCDVGPGTYRDPSPDRAHDQDAGTGDGCPSSVPCVRSQAPDVYVRRRRRCSR